MVEEDRHAIRAEFVKGLKSLGINPDFHKFHLGSVVTNAESDIATRSYSVIDMVTSSTSSPIMFGPIIISRSPISVASIPSHTGNGGSAPGFSHLSHTTHAAAPPPMFAATHWKPKEPPCFFGHNTEDVHTWTSLVRHYLAFMVGSDAQ